jgi:isocitrate dehydrogenase
VPQLKAAVAELQAAGFAVPDYPETPTTDDEKAARTAYDAVKGSAVNPVLREGNSDRRAPASVKRYAQKHPHSMGAWSPDTRSHVATMSDGDFRHSETSVTIPAPTTLRIEHVAEDGSTTVLKDGLRVLEGEIVDAAVMRKAALTAFLTQQVADAKEQGVLFSVHLKATMMKVSDPIIFGHVVKAYFADVFEQYADDLASVGADPNQGLGGVLSDLQKLPEDRRRQSRRRSPRRTSRDRRWRRSTRARASPTCTCRATSSSTPRCRRRSARRADVERLDELQDTKFVIPDSSYAALYDETVKHCREHGAFDPTTMGTTPNVGLMAQKAEEYGSHDKTFEIPSAGTVDVVDESGAVLLSQDVEAGDIFRACQTKDAPIRDWVQLAVRRARATGRPAVFWLDETRAHDAEVLTKVRAYLAEEETDGLTIEIMDVAAATRYTLDRARRGEDTISVTGNVLRDYLTDLFPILELGTSAKMLSIVPLMNGGGLFETGAGGSAPKHVQQLVKENYLRWDSLGEFLALAVSFEFLGEKTSNPRATLLGTTLDAATGRVLEEDRSPARKVGQIDNRGSHFYLALYWAQALAQQTEDTEAAELFSALADRLAADEQTITAELLAVQGSPADLGGYYSVDKAKTDAVMRPSATFNAALADF